ncbi:MAG: aldolase/citrate lyase family protein [Actinomycetota bacterium]
MAAGRVTGTFVKLPALEAIDIVAGSGLDCSIVDLEHSQLAEGEALRLVRHAHALGHAVVVRVPSCDPGQLNRLLEAGASGIQLSTVRSVAQVRELVAATRYPPGGERSVSLAHPVAAYGAVPLREAVRGDHPLLVGQIETADTDDPLKEICGAGLDVAFAGVTDLEVGLGFDRDRLATRVAEIADAAAAAGIAFGAFAATPEAVPRDARYVALSSDVSLLRAAVDDAARRGGEAP